MRFYACIRDRSAMAMEWFQESLGDPPTASIAKTNLAAFYVIALLVGGIFLGWELTNVLSTEVVAAIDQPAPELAPH